MANGQLRRRRRVKRKTRRHYGMGLKDVLAAGVKLAVVWEEINVIKEWELSVLQGITEDFQDHGYDEKRQTQFTLHQNHFSSSQSLQEARHVEACQQGPDQCRE